MKVSETEKARMKKYYLANIDKIKAKRKEYRVKNKNKLAIQKRKYYLANIEKFKVDGIYRRYKISAKDYTEMIKNQNGQCAICESTPDGVHNNDRALNVDHCHDTGKVRGLLCNKCNKGLGFFRDSPKLLQIAREYIIQNGSAGEDYDTF